MIATRIPRAAVLLAVFLLLGSGLVAQEEPPAGPDPAGRPNNAAPDNAGKAQRRVLTFVEFDDEASYSPVTRSLIRSSLVAALTEGQQEAAVVLRPGVDAVDDRQRTLAALDAGCSAWLLVRLEGSEEAPAYSARGFDLISRKVLFEIEQGLSQELRTRDLERRLWDGLPQALSETLATVIPGTVITFEGAPGTQISGVTEERITIGEDGTVDRSLLNPNLHQYRATRLGYEPVEGILVVGDDPETVVLSQERSKVHTVGASLYSFSFPQISYSYGILPRWLYARVLLTSYSVGLVAAQNGNEWLVSLPLQELQLQVGGFFLAQDVNLRPYGGILGGLRVVTASELISLDPLSPFQAGAFLGVEFPVIEDFHGFLEWNAVLLFSPDPSLLVGSYPAGTSLDIFPIPMGHIEPFRLNIGVRWRF